MEEDLNLEEFLIVKRMLKNSDDLKYFQERNLHYFPRDLNIEEIKEAIRSFAEFKYSLGHTEKRFIKTRVQISYLSEPSHLEILLPNPYAEPDPRLSFYYKLKREYSSLVISNEGEFLARGFHKILEIDQTYESKLNRVSWNDRFRVFPLADGHTVTPFLLDSKVKWEILKTPFDVDGMVAKCDGLTEFAKHWLERGYTPIFKFISKENKNTIFFPKETGYSDSIVLIGIRNRVSGDYASYEELVSTCEKYSVNYVKELSEGDGIIKLLKQGTTESIKEIKNIKFFKGYLIQFENKRMVKIHTEWYNGLKRFNSDLLPLQGANLQKFILSERFNQCFELFVQDLEVKPLHMISCWSYVDRLKKFIDISAESVLNYIQHLKANNALKKDVAKSMNTDKTLVKSTILHFFGRPSFTKDEIRDHLKLSLLKLSSTDFALQSGIEVKL